MLRVGRVILICLWSFLTVGSLFSQTKTIDSLRRQLKVVEGEDKMRTYRNLYEAYWGKNIKESLKWAKLCLNLAYELNDTVILAQVYSDLSIQNSALCKFEQSVELSDSAIYYGLVLNDSTGLSYMWSSKGFTYMRTGNVEKAYDCLEEAFRYSELQEDLSFIGYNYADMATVLLNSEDYPMAEKYLNIADSLFVYYSPEGSVSYSANIRAQLEIARGNYNKAIDILQRSGQLSYESGDMFRWFETEIMLATVYLNSDNSIVDKYYNRFSNIDVTRFGKQDYYYLFLIKYYLYKRLPAKAKIYLDKLNKILIFEGENRLPDYYYLMSEYYYLHHDYTKASEYLLHYQQKMTQIQDNLAAKKKGSVYNKFQKDILEDELKKLRLQDHLSEKDRKDQEQELNKLNNALFNGAVTFFVMLFITTYIYIIYRKLRAKYKQSSSVKSVLTRNIDKSKSDCDVLEKENFDLEELAFVARSTEKIVYIANSAGEIEWVNSSFRRKTGYSFQEYSKRYGRKLGQIVNETSLKRINECIANKTSVTYYSDMPHKDGHVIYFQTVLNPYFDRNDELEKIVAIDTQIQQTQVELKIQKSKIEKQLVEISLQRNKINEQSQLISLQMKKVMDNIELASHIQEAILPKDEVLRRLFDEYLVYYKAKDILSGDFYWAFAKNNRVFIAVGDCTGHGVPGAFMSILGMTFLSKIVIERSITDSGKILDELKRMVIQTLNQTGEVGEASDGMDIALCVIDMETGDMQFSGANNPIYIIKNNEFELLPPNKMPIGIHYGSADHFASTDYKLEKGDKVYLFSDGYPDQFGGPLGKKFKYNNFKKLLHESSSVSMEEQLNIIDDTFKMWKGNQDQVDDVAILGFKF
jgi:serine phosphatase RsbU (regulator of sigma subunit)